MQLLVRSRTLWPVDAQAPRSQQPGATVAMMAAIARPVGVAVSTSSRKTYNVIRRSPRSAMVRVTSATDRPSRSPTWATFR